MLVICNFWGNLRLPSGLLWGSLWSLSGLTSEVFLGIFGKTLRCLCGSLFGNLRSPWGVLWGHFRSNMKFTLGLLWGHVGGTLDVPLGCMRFILCHTCLSSTWVQQEAIKYGHFPLVKIWSENVVREDTSNGLLHT